MTKATAGNKNLRLTLYVADQSLNSSRARANLNQALERHGHEQIQPEIVDIYEHRERTLQDKVLLTPMLVLNTPSDRHTLVGDLSITEPLDLLLDYLEAS